MITSIKKWKTIEQLQKVVLQYPDKVQVNGTAWTDGNPTGTFDGIVSDIPYGVTVYVVHKKETYAFKKGTDGRFQVHK